MKSSKFNLLMFFLFLTTILYSQNKRIKVKIIENETRRGNILTKKYYFDKQGREILFEEKISTKEKAHKKIKKKYTDFDSLKLEIKLYGLTDNYITEYQYNNNLRKVKKQKYNCSDTLLNDKCKLIDIEKYFYSKNGRLLNSISYVNDNKQLQLKEVYNDSLVNIKYLFNYPLSNQQENIETLMATIYVNKNKCDKTGNELIYDNRIGNSIVNHYQYNKDCLIESHTSEYYKTNYAYNVDGNIISEKKYFLKHTKEISDKNLLEQIDYEYESGKLVRKVIKKFKSILKEKDEDYTPKNEEVWNYKYEYY